MLNLYGRVGEDAEKIHKKVRILEKGGQPREITDFSDTVISEGLTRKKKMLRYYFLNLNDRDDARRAMGG